MDTEQGIDWSGIGTGANRDPEAPGYRYGVISQHSLDQDALQELWTSVHSTDVSFEYWLNELKNNLKGVLGDYVYGKDRLEEIVSGIIDDYCLTDHYEGDGDSSFSYNDGRYIVENCLITDITVLKSPYYTYAKFCSPCVPGACNLDSPLEDFDDAKHCRAYCFGPEWFEGAEAPYPVFEVATGAQVN